MRRGASPIRATRLPYGRQWVDEADVAAVTRVLRSDWLTTGPQVEAFEQAVAGATDTKHAISLSHGTAALHAVMFALGIGPGDEVIVPAMTFAATANCVAFLGGTPVFGDVDPDRLLLDPEVARTRITSRTKAILAVDYAGQPCDYDRLRSLAQPSGLALVADACHAMGARYRDRPVGCLADASAFSFHPVKHVTTGEGGAVSTDDPQLARRVRLFRNHGITSDFRTRELEDSPGYEMVELGHNCRLSDIHCALGISQLAKLPRFLERRRAIAARYDEALARMPAVQPLAVADEVSHAYHLYVVRLEPGQLRVDRNQVYRALRAEGIGVSVHYMPAHLHPFYRQRFGTKPGDCPVAEAASESILSLPIFPRMEDREVEDVVLAMHKVTESYRR